MNFKDSYNQKIKNIDTYIYNYLSGYDKASNILIDAMKYSVLNGGKRLRSILCTEICKMLGGSVKAAIPFACGIELIHAYSLVHDDLPAMDNADYRRGQLSCHKKYGEAMGILCGDALLNSAYELMAFNCNNANDIKAMHLLALLYIKTGERERAHRILTKARKIDIIGFGLRSWRDSKSKEVEALLRKGCEIRILTMDPDSPSLKQRELDEKQEPGSIALTIVQLHEWADKLNAKSKKGKITIKYYDAQPLNFMFLMNTRLFIGPYEYGKGSQQTISYEFNNTGEAHKYYMEYFNGLWNDNEFAKIKQ